MKNTLFNLAWAITELSVVLWACNGGPVGASNVVAFLSVANLLQFFGVLIAWDEIKKEPETRPEWLLSTLNFLDLACLGVLAFAGWWVFLACYSLGVFAAFACRNHNQLTN